MILTNPRKMSIFNTKNQQFNDDIKKMRNFELESPPFKRNSPNLIKL